MYDGNSTLSIQRESGNGTKRQSEKATSPNKHVAIGAPAYQRMIERKAALQRMHDENEAKQNKRNARGRRHDICKPNARSIQVRATCG